MKFKAIFIFALSGGILWPLISSAVIYGNDNRVGLSPDQVKSRKLTPIVELFIQKPGKGSVSCTGTWISDRHILTARHCVATAQSILVYSAYHNYIAAYRAKAKKFYVDLGSSDDQMKWYNGYGPNAGSRASRYDWAVIEIQKETISDEPEFVTYPDGRRARNTNRYGDGSIMGWLPIVSDEILDTEPVVRTAAFHGDADNALYTEMCRYRPRSLYDDYRIGMFRRGLFEIDCDMMEGASGSAILSCVTGKCKIVGVYSAEYPEKDNGKNYGGLLVPEFSHTHGNAAVRSRNFMTPVSEILRGNTSNVKSFDLVLPKCLQINCDK